ncbi:MAG: MmgE/PrpD family protein, partial [Gemmatimonadales bacterium]
MTERSTVAQRLAGFVCNAEFDRLSKGALEQLELRVLDSIGCALGALRSPVPTTVLDHVIEFGGNPLVTLIGGGMTAPDRAAFYNGALVRYLDFNDSYLAPNETCHPSDNLAAVLAAAEYADAGGRDLLTALAVAYQVQCRLSDEAPVRAKGFDHTTQGSYAAACGVAKVLGLDVERTANAIAISGTAFNALRVTRTGRISNWKGLAYPNTAFCATHAAFLAMHGITGPPEVFEGNKGFMDSIAGAFEIDWSKEDLERVKRTIVKRFNAEIHSQSTLEGVLELKGEHQIDPEAIEAIEIETFDVAFDIIGGGEEGDKSTVQTKEEADHSLPYMVAAALLDGDVMPAQYLL